MTNVTKDEEAAATQQEMVDGMSGDTLLLSIDGFRYLQEHWGSASGEIEPGRSHPLSEHYPRYRLPIRMDRFRHVKPGTSLPYNLSIVAGENLAQTSHIYFGGRQTTIRIRTVLGFELEATHRHRIWAMTVQGPDWVRMDTLQPRQQIAVQYGNECWPQYPYRENHRERFNIGKYLNFALNFFGNSFPPPDVLPPGMHLTFVTLGYCRRQTVENLEDLLTFCTVPDEDGFRTLKGIWRPLFRALQLMFLNLGILARFRWQSDSGTLSIPPETLAWLRETATDNAQPHCGVYWDEVERVEPSSTEVFNVQIPGEQRYIANGFIHQVAAT